jgi:hypothetical protein
VVDPSGKFVYGADQGPNSSTPGKILGYSITAHGVLTPITFFSPPLHATSITVVTVPEL